MFSVFRGEPQPGENFAELNAGALVLALDTMTFTLYHEAGHALDDIHSVGTGGNFESVVDTIGTVFAVETGQPLGSLFVGLFFGMVASKTGSAGIHGNGIDRAFDLICWATGSSSRAAALVPELSATLVRNGRDCVAEYADGKSFVENLIPDLSDLPPADALQKVRQDE